MRVTCLKVWDNFGVDGGGSWGIVQCCIHQTDHFNGFDSTKGSSEAAS